MQMPAWLRLLLHRSGVIASPSLAFRGVLFGPQRRDLAAEALQATARAQADRCPLCEPSAPAVPQA